MLITNLIIKKSIARLELPYWCIIREIHEMMYEKVCAKEFQMKPMRDKYLGNSFHFSTRVVCSRVR